MSRLRAALTAVWEFVVGDDWRSAVGVVLALGLTGLVAGLGVSAWWVMALAVPLLLGLSILRAARAAERERDSPGPREGTGARSSEPTARPSASGEARGAEGPIGRTGAGRRAPMHHH